MLKHFYKIILITAIMKKLYLLAAVFALFLAAPAFADELVESYIARLGHSDHFNSYGERLTSVAAIIRQDRANYHVFGRYDPEDERDSFFASKRNRAILESMLQNGRISRAALNEIVHGEPLVKISIWNNGYGRDYVEVHVIRY
jgi:hypothetical protein